MRMLTHDQAEVLCLIATWLGVAVLVGVELWKLRRERKAK